MTVLILGSGGREHAIALAVSNDPQVGAVHVAPGNPGTASFAVNHPVDASDADAVVALAREISADLVVVGPEAPLVAGVADAVRAAGIDCFGPSREAARLEGSKAFAKEIMTAAGVPTAEAVACSSVEEAEAALDRFGAPHVVKDDGLAAGKGVVVTSDRAEALAHARHCIESGHPIVIEDYLKGPEVSLFAICDGTRALPLQPAQDFKRVGDGGTGPNTGGMGAYTPLPWAPADLVETVTTSIITPTLTEMNRRGTPFQGLLYVGLSLTSQGPRVVEFNVRFGDPETQPLLSMIESPLAQVMRAAAKGDLSAFDDGLEFRRGFGVGVVLASEGYPGEVTTGREIQGALASDGGSDPDIIQAGTALDGDRLVSAGGRVLVALGHGETLTGARQAAYARIGRITLEGGFHRGDIALTAAEEEAFTALSEPKGSLGDPGANS
ncbi:phosphoribosylamine--glycine ligase [Acidipropionibacterium acidipropionici]|uniref:Phosphoribosylamine--glycine ligase n=1 Tax=Acidipropionibacterium acidipropionici TaxID=1748 RepID=A0AAC9APF8_9ACTN|nr:phosphoribosylamine--glycine ligase [Acidipropionibacterium acidipropionici]AMS07062.1 phosphoribosylamine--glycine ligase [Acidipropionibacterium acidipropionici]AOZ48257.1 phosphoribosylamine--glycine ligase [Acidipropionibacterium acidipropionici]AZP39347.1 phosphoribosylamine--glycine ligase [Acidipropionibacterium acidipropionici]QCV96716.1 phosphoribosylamine--glycine ligase [Acidipropionibacterium acidipropionici]